MDFQVGVDLVGTLEMTPISVIFCFYVFSALIFDVKDKHHLPSHITYKIRMDIDRVDTSKQVMDR